MISGDVIYLAASSALAKARELEIEDGDEITDAIYKRIGMLRKGTLGETFFGK